MIIETETRNKILRVYNWWRIFNYGNYGNLDERDSFPFLVSVVTDIPRFRESYFPFSRRIFSNTISQNGNIYELLIEYSRKKFVSRSEYSYVRRYFREFNLSLPSIRNFYIFPDQIYFSYTSLTASSTIT